MPRPHISIFGSNQTTSEFNQLVINRNVLVEPIQEFGTFESFMRVDKYELVDDSGELTMNVLRGISHIRPDNGTVYLPERAPEHPSKKPYAQYLQRSAWIRFHEGDKDVYILCREIKNLLRKRYNTHYQEYFILEDKDRQYLMVFPDIQARDLAAQEGMFVVPALGVSFTLHPYGIWDGMTHQPSRFQMWIQLVGLPLFLWNPDEVDNVIGKLGYATLVMPYGYTGYQIQRLDILIVTNRNPAYQPKHLTVKVR